MRNNLDFILSLSSIPRILTASFAAIISGLLFSCVKITELHPSHVVGTRAFGKGMKELCWGTHTAEISLTGCCLWDLLLDSCTNLRAMMSEGPTLDVMMQWVTADATSLGMNADSGCSIHLSDSLDVPLPALPAPFPDSNPPKNIPHFWNGRINTLFSAVNRKQASGTIQWLTLSGVHLDD